MRKCFNVLILIIKQSLISCSKLSLMEWCRNISWLLFIWFVCERRSISELRWKKKNQFSVQTWSRNCFQNAFFVCVSIVANAALSFTAPPTVRIIHSGNACNVEEERHTERVYTIREGETLELTCLVTGHPRPQVRKPPQPIYGFSCKVRSAPNQPLIIDGLSFHCAPTC